MTDAVARHLDGSARAAVHAPIGRAKGLPPGLYTDPEVAAAENARLFARNWMCAGYAHEIARPGDALPLTIAGAPIVFVHGRDGAFHCFHNVCPHRGNLVVTRPLGGAAALVCRYHGWGFDLDGRLQITPHWGGHGQPNAEGFDRACHGLKPVRMARWHDWLFVNLSGDAPAFEAYMQPFARHCDEYDLSLLRHAATSRFEIRANWKLVEENFLEVLHLPKVHRGLNAVAPFQDHEMVLDGPCLGTIVRVGLPEHWADPALPRFPRLGADNRTAKNLALFPNFKLVLGPDHCASMIEFPLDAATTRQRWDFYFVGETALDPRFGPARKAIADFFVEVNGEDVGILEDMQAARASPVAGGGVFSAAWEPVVHGFQKLVADALA
jgi:choline monooxygenase